MVAQPTPAPANSLLGFILLASLVGFALDWRYKRKGGKKPTKKDYLILGIIVLVVGGSIFTFGALGYNGAILGEATVPLFVWIFGIWELSRWRTRMKNPLPGDKGVGL